MKVPGSLLMGVLLLTCPAGGEAMAKTTQIVVQLRYDGAAGLGLLWRVYSWERKIERRCGTLCFVDGHDLGSGTANVFLLVDDENVKAAVNAVASLVKMRRLPQKMTIGVAEYANEERTDWVYRPAYPAGLDHFDLTYPDHHRGP